MHDVHVLQQQQQQQSLAAASRKLFVSTLPKVAKWASVGTSRDCRFMMLSANFTTTSKKGAAAPTSRTSPDWTRVARRRRAGGQVDMVDGREADARDQLVVGGLGEAQMCAPVVGRVPRGRARRRPDGGVGGSVGRAEPKSPGDRTVVQPSFGIHQRPQIDLNPCS